MVQQLRGDVGSAPFSGQSRGALDLLDHVVIRRVGGERELAASLFGVGGDLGQAPVRLVSATARGVRIDRGPVYRMSETEIETENLDQACVDRLLEVHVQRRVGDDLPQRVNPRARHRGGEEEQVAGLR